MYFWFILFHFYCKIISLIATLIKIQNKEFKKKFKSILTFSVDGTKVVFTFDNTFYNYLISVLSFYFIFVLLLGGFAWEV